MKSRGKRCCRRTTSESGFRHRSSTAPGTRARDLSRARSVVGLCVAASMLVLAATPVGPGPPRVLRVPCSGGSQQDVVRRPAPAELSIAERVVADLGRRSASFEVTHASTREDLGRLSVASVREHRALLFFTTGELPLAV